MTITPFLWFETQAEEAMHYYLSIFPSGKSNAVHRAQGRVMSVEFELEGQRFMALNGGTPSKFTESISFFVSCDTQADIDRLWTTLTGDGGAPSRCGWLKDKYGHVVADHSVVAGPAAERRWRRHARRTRAAGDAADGEAGRRHPATGLRRQADRA